MRWFFSYALVAFATTAYAAPLKVRTDELAERTQDFDVRGLTANVDFVEIGKGYIERRQDAVDAQVILLSQNCRWSNVFQSYFRFISLQ